MKVILYIAASLDGYIAGPGDDLSFLSMVETPGEDYGYVDFTQSVDRVIMGRKTYDWIMKQVSVFPHADMETYILTRTAKDSIGNTHFYTGDLRELVEQMLQMLCCNWDYWMKLLYLPSPLFWVLAPNFLKKAFQKGRCSCWVQNHFHLA
jgi:hypothetical protein